MVYVERDMEKGIKKWLYEREIVAIRGPRQCGKTTLLNRMKETLLKDGVPEKNIHYINFEDDLLRLKFEENWQEFIKFYLNEGKNYFLIDEVQYVKEIGKKLKLVFDTFSDVKIIITGSSSFDLTNLGKYLVGRVIFFDLLPFSFHEFLRAKGEKYEKLHNEIRLDLSKADSKIRLKQTVFMDELNALLHEYITYGSYPRIVLEKDKSKKKELLKNLFTTYIEKDIVSLYGIKYRDGAVKLLKALSSMMGGVIKYETLSQTTGLKYNEVKELLALLQDSFVIYIVPPFYKNLASEIRKNPKIYFVDYGIRNLLLENFNSHNFDFLYENFVHNELKRNHAIKYWRTTTKSEVDLIIDEQLIPVEVKSGDKSTRALLSFMETYGSKFGIIANLKVAEERENNIYSIPFVYLS